MTQEIFTRWDPWWWYRDVPASIDAIYEDLEGFRIIITANDCPPTRVSIVSGALVLYRVYDEIGLVGLNHQGVRPGHCFYKSDSSPLLSESSMMNSAAYGRPSLHYAIYTGDRCIDIISTAEPRFVLLREFASGRYESERPERTADERKSLITEVARPMNTEFQRAGPNSAKSEKGFTVTWRPSGGVDYADEAGTVRVDSEMLVKPSRILVYPRSGGLKTLTDERAEAVLKNVVRALEFLGHQVER
jgi:hypothetical protein